MARTDGWPTSPKEPTTRSWTDTTFGPTLDDMPRFRSMLQHIPYHWAARVDQQHPEMFSWLGMLDLKVDVIVGLMVLISIINMISALLIIILERRSQVGLLKALGMSDGAVVQAFLWHAARILGQGFAWGNPWIGPRGSSHVESCAPGPPVLRQCRPHLGGCARIGDHGGGGLWALRGRHGAACLVVQRSALP